MFRTSLDAVRPAASSKKPSEETENYYDCDLCNEGGWLCETDVEIHRKNKHKLKLNELLKDKNEHYCTICVRPQGSAEDLLRHVKSEHLLSSPDSKIVEHEIYVCGDCERVFFNKKLLAMHIKRTHSSKTYRDRVKVECPVCSKEIKITSAIMWSHFLFHSIVGVSTCQICLEPCENRKELRRHLTKHPKYYYCTFCNFNTHSSVYFNEHMDRHRLKANKLVVKTPSFKKYFVQRSVYQWRYEIDTNRLKGLMLPRDVKICVLCREICTDEDQMRQHIEVDHAPEVVFKKQYQCNCGEEFFNSVLLKHHVFKMGKGHKHK